MEFCNGGDLARHLQRQQGRLLQEDDIMLKFVQICLGLHHVHKQGIMYVWGVGGKNMFCDCFFWCFFFLVCVCTYVYVCVCVCTCVYVCVRVYVCALTCIIIIIIIIIIITTTMTISSPH